ncbi:hypothetical protein BD410DRAFT_813640 [Rickenella mellea]|uniref:Uncharacterized protein n=1 Tax=Rickenella mellea TaxID=50990 RepID=A0A4Y7QF06_9AGAM|nr:hypothetical protein BD410DRAFT_813640 [Rickenella mellea]
MSSSQCEIIDSVQDCLTPGDRIGLAFTAESGFISLTAVLILFFLILRNVIRYTRNPPPNGWSLVQQPADVYMLSLFTSDILQALGAIMDVKWAHEGIVKTGTFCAAQGLIQQVGEAGVAMATLSITIHTFITVWSRKAVHSRRGAVMVVVMIWLFVILYASINLGIHSKGSIKYYSPTPYWCWIGKSFGKQRVTGEYMWLWIALFFSILMYVPLVLWNRGNIIVDNEHWWKVQVRWTALPESAEGKTARKRPSANSLAILAYPIVYSIVVLPLSVGRWIGFVQERHGANHVPPAATFGVTFVFGLSGALNVLLLITTRPNLLLFGAKVEKRRPSISVTGRAAVPEEGARRGQSSEGNTAYSDAAHTTSASPKVMADGQLNTSAESVWTLPSANGAR